MARPVSDDREKQFMKLPKKSLVRLLLDEIKKNKKLKSERDKWRGKYNRLKSEFNLLQDKNKSLKEEIQQWLNAVNHK